MQVIHNNWVLFSAPSGYYKCVKMPEHRHIGSPYSLTVTETDWAFSYLVRNFHRVYVRLLKSNSKIILAHVYGEGVLGCLDTVCLGTLEHLVVIDVHFTSLKD